MNLNTLKPAVGSKKDRKRVGRGIGCGNGKTCGRGHKGQHSRSGGFSKRGFEGGQMPLQRRLPKVGFASRSARYSAEIRLGELNGLTEGVVDLAALKAANIIAHHVRKAKVIDSGEISIAVTLQGINVTKGARSAIEAAGGKIDS